MAPLTMREKTCLQWAAAGKTSYETGIILCISSRTVDFHIFNACAKLGVHSRQAAIAIALELRLLPDIRQLLPNLPAVAGAANVTGAASQVPVP